MVLEAIDRLINARKVVNSEIGIVFMVLELVLASGVLFQSFVVKKTGSIAVVADSLHYRVDILVNIGRHRKPICRVFWHSSLR